MKLRDYFLKFKPKHDEELLRLEQKIMRQIGEESTTVTREWQQSHTEMQGKLEALASELDTRLNEWQEPLSAAIRVEADNCARMQRVTDTLQTEVDRLVEMASKQDEKEL